VSLSTQLVIAESSPGLDGHKLAASLSKVPSIGVTLIPDSNIYALMARVNKVSMR
jgi:translation initiation factor 2B subunit (eIF-2B alpha/beta/delta family)